MIRSKTSCASDNGHHRSMQPTMQPPLQSTSLQSARIATTNQHSIAKAQSLSIYQKSQSFTSLPFLPLTETFIAHHLFADESLQHAFSKLHAIQRHCRTLGPYQQNPLRTDGHCPSKTCSQASSARQFRLARAIPSIMCGEQSITGCVGHRAEHAKETTKEILNATI